MENIVCRHGVPEELLSDRGANFLSDLILEMCSLLGIRKVNTSRYHPQTDGLVEKFNSMITNMIAKSVDVIVSSGTSSCQRSYLHTVQRFRSPQESLRSFFSMVETRVCRRLVPWSSLDPSTLLTWTIINWNL